jgi:hypothetical protein
MTSLHNPLFSRAADNEDITERSAAGFSKKLAVVPALPTKTPPDRRRKLWLIDGGKQ